MNYKKIILSLTLALVSVSLFSQTIRNLAIVATDLESGRTVVSRNANQKLKPASITKLITTATAIELLGRDFMFKTEILALGEVKDSTLHGDLIVKASGDPMLGSAYATNEATFLREWSQIIKSRGIREIAGDIVADVSVYDKEAYPIGWGAPDLGNYYAAGVYGISFADNVLRVSFSSGKSGTRAKVMGFSPEIKDCKITSSVVAQRSVGDAVFFSGKSYDNDRRATGKIEANSTNFVIRADIGNPNMVLLQSLRDTLASLGVATKGSLRVEFKPQKYGKLEPQPIIYQYSPPLSDIIRIVNVYSNNMYAEALLKRLSLEISDKGNFPKGIKVIENYWQSKGLDCSLLDLKDGSGLTTNNGFTARFLNDLLIYMDGSKNRDVFLQSLPIAGQNGTVRRFLKGTSLEGLAYLKSGSITGVQCYAGYIEANGKRYSLVVMANGFRNGRRSAVAEIEREILRVIENDK